MVFSLLFCTAFQVSALSVTDANWQNKIADYVNVSIAWVVE